MHEFPNQEKLNLKISEITGQQNFDKILELQKNDGFDHSYYLTRERLEKLEQRGEKIFVVYLEDEPVGFAIIDLEVRARIHFFSIDKNNTRKGIGTELLEKIIQEAASQSYEKIHAFVEADSPAEEFFGKNKFEKVGFHKNRYGEGKDSNIMERKI